MNAKKNSILQIILLIAAFSEICQSLSSKKCSALADKTQAKAEKKATNKNIKICKRTLRRKAKCNTFLKSIYEDLPCVTTPAATTTPAKATTTEPPPVCTYEENICETCGTSPGIAPVIIGGEDAITNEFPYHAVIRTKNAGRSGTLICMGAIISSTYVVTNAECVDNDSSNGIYQWAKITVGKITRYTRMSGSVEVYAKNRHIHPMFQETNTQQYNIALLEIPKLEFNDNIQPVCLPATNSDEFYGLQADVSGFGLEDSSSTSLPNDLQKTTMTVKTTAECTALGTTVPLSRLCLDSGSNSVSTCFGDTGAPFVVQENREGTMKRVLIGLAPNACNIRPITITKMTDYVDWIRAIVTGPTCI